MSNYAQVIALASSDWLSDFMVAANTFVAESTRLRSTAIRSGINLGQHPSYEHFQSNRRALAQRGEAMVRSHSECPIVSGVVNTFNEQGHQWLLGPGQVLTKLWSDTEVKAQKDSDRDLFCREVAKIMLCHNHTPEIQIAVQAFDRIASCGTVVLKGRDPGGIARDPRDKELLDCVQAFAAVIRAYCDQHNFWAQRPNPYFV